MKTLNSKLLVLMMGISFMGAACSNSSTSGGSGGSQPYNYNNNGNGGNNGNGNNNGSGNGGGSGSGTGTGGDTITNTATFTPVSLQEFNSYVGTHPLNNPTDFKITVDLTNVNSLGIYSGSVKISYVDTGYLYTGNFNAGSGQNASYDGLKDNGVYEAAYNRWFTLSGQKVFSGVFQDQYGAIILVIDKTVSAGDAQGSISVSGSVYYKNFAQSYAQQSPYRKCWFIYNGPYDCRDSALSAKSTLYPYDGGYKKLGTFTGLSKTQAFH